MNLTDDLANDADVQHLFTKLEIYKSWYEATRLEAIRLRAQRDALRDELKRYCMARVE